MVSLLQDIRYALRLLRTHRASSMLAVATLAVGIGVATALFTVIDAALLRPLPYAHPEELVSLSVFRAGRSGYAPAIADMRRWRESGVLSHAGIGRVTGYAFPPIVDAGVPERRVVASITEGFLETYGMAPVLGRFITVDDTRDGAPPVALLGHAYWQRRFGGDRAVVGRSIRIENAPVTIIGVLPAGFYPNTALWQPLLRDDSGASTIGRLRPGVTIEQATSVLAGTPVSGTAATEPADRRARVRSLYAGVTSGVGSTIATLSYAVGLILTIACVNVAGLLLARGAVRGHELAIRASIGASRRRLIRQLLIESLVLSGAAAIVGVMLAGLCIDALVSIIPLSLPANVEAAINGKALAFAIAAAVTTAVLFGLIPALRLSRAAVGNRLAMSSHRHGSALTRRGGTWLIGAEVALAVVLLAGAGLLVRSFERRMSGGIGFETDGVVTMEVQPLAPSPGVNAQFYPALLAAARAQPEVLAVGALDNMSVHGGAWGSTLRKADGNGLPGYQRSVFPGYFEALGLTASPGRLPVEADLYANEGAVLLNEEAAKKFFSGSSPVGARLESLPGRDQPAVPMRIVGVVPNLLFSPGSSPFAEMYLVPRLTHSELFGLVVRYRPGQSIARERWRKIAESIGPAVFVGETRPAAAEVSARVATHHHRMLLIGLLGGLGLLLALVGILSMTAYAVARRTQEVGVRMALGAAPSAIVFGIVRDTAWPVCTGLVLGLAGASYATRVLVEFLFETSTRDTVTFVAVAVLMAIVAMVAAWLPARRAARVDPVIALRAE